MAGVVSFYSYFTTVPRGKHLVRACLGTACYVRGGKQVLQALKATLGIAQTHLVAGQNELAVTSLGDFLKTNPPAEYAATANQLLGTAYENLGKFAEALAAYRKSADLAAMDYLKAAALIDAGRAARLSKKLDEAKAIYNEVITKYPKTGSVTEAQVRLAEISGGA